MTEDAVKMIADALAQRLGGDAAALQAALGEDPLAAAVALVAAQATSGARADPAGVVRQVACIVGGCPVCLGTDVACVECEGKGAPGSRVPDRAALLRWVHRPLRRLGLCVGRLRQDHVEHDGQGGYSR